MNHWIIKYVENGEERQLTMMTSMNADETIDDFYNYHPKAELASIEEELPDNGGRPFALPILKEIVKKKRPDISDADLDEFQDLLMWEPSNKWMPGAFVLSPPQAKKFFESGEDYTDFVYIRSLGIVIFNVWAHCSHEIFLGAWHSVIENVILGNKSMEYADDNHKYDRDSCERFLHAGYGFYMSSAYGTHCIQISTEHRMTFAERQVFKGIPVRELDKDRD